jgi:hypothetical protein
VTGSAAALLILALSVVGGTPASANPSAWAATEIASALNTNDFAQTSAISCASAENCTAAGYYRVADNAEQAFVDTETAGRWAPAQEVAGGLNVGGIAQINAISCPEVGDCVAVGQYTDGAQLQQAFLVEEASGFWEPPVELGGSLNVDGNGAAEAVSCPAAGDCVAVGHYFDAHSRFQAFIAEEKSFSWTAAQEVAQGTPPSSSAQLNAVSCSAPGQCVAGGERTTGSGSTMHAFVLTESSSAWGTPTTPAGALSTDPSDVNSIACPATGSCTAAGQISAGGQQGFAVSESAGTWGAATVIGQALNTGKAADVLALSCASPGNCALGGWYSIPLGDEPVIWPFVASETAGTWSPAQAITPSDNLEGAGQINAMSCVAVGQCVAGGWYYHSGQASQGVIVRQVGPSWQSPQTVTGSLNDGNAQVLAVTCVSRVDCVVGGGYVASTAGQQAFVAEGEPATPPLPSAPGGLKATAGTEQVALSWSASSTQGCGSAAALCAPTGYVVSWSPSGSSSPPTTETLPATATSTTLSGLANGTLYDLSVAAINRYGTGASSSTTSTPTYLAAPPAPMDLNATVSGTLGKAGSISVSWTAPPLDGCTSGASGYSRCVVASYALTYTKWTSASTSVPVTVPITPGSATSCNLSTFLNGSTDHVTLRARNSFGLGATVSISLTLKPTK